MRTKQGKKLYLSFLKKDTPEWSINIDDTCLFEMEHDAKKYADKWFKKFKDYKIQPIIIGCNLRCKEGRF